MKILSRLSIGHRLYLIFVIFGTVSIVLSAVAGWSIYTLDRLNQRVEAAENGRFSLQALDGLIYKTVMESRGIYMSAKPDVLERFAKGQNAALKDMDGLIERWRKTVTEDVQADFERVAKGVIVFRDFRFDLARVGLEKGNDAARVIGDSEAARSARQTLNKEMDALAKRYDKQREELGEAVEAVYRQMLFFSILGAISTLLTLVVGVLIVSRTVVRPLEALSAIMGRVVNGESAIEVAFTERTDEVGRMARSLDVFRQAMSDRAAFAERGSLAQKEREARQKTIDSEIAGFRAAVAESFSSMTQAIEGMMSTSGRLNDVSQRASNHSSAMANSTRDTSSNVSTVAAAAEELSVSVQTIAGSVQRSNVVVARASSVAGETTGKITALAGAADKIGSVVNLIQAIAAQTNLLALNATIEAARAGEAGKGFAVVAAEVKGLAAQTAKATEEISSQISGIQGSTNEVVSAIDSIVATLSEIDQVSREIGASVEEQGQATSEISRNAQSAATGTVSLAKDVDDVTATVGETEEAARSVRSAADSLAKQAHALKSSIDGFLQRVAA